MAREPQEEAARAFSLRFLVRFCEYFGLVETRREKTGLYRERLSVKTSSFFERFLLWKEHRAAPGH